MLKLASYLALLALSTAPLAAKDTKNILFLAGGPSHSPGAHEHRAGCILLADALNESGLDLHAEVVNVWPESPDAFDGVDAIVVYADKGGAYSDEQYHLLDEKIKSGTGIMFIHFGVHPLRATDDKALKERLGAPPSTEIGHEYFIPWTGGFFESGYSVNPHWTAELTPQEGHPIGNGIEKPVLANDEFYYNMRFPSKRSCRECYPLIDAQLDEDRITTYNNLWTEEGDELIGQRVKLMWGRDSKTQGRGVGFTGGHWHRNWAIDDFRKVVLNAITWVARADVPEGGVQSAPISDAQLNVNLDGVPEIPLTKPTPESILAMEPMLRPRDPANYDRKEHHKWVEEMKAKTGK